MTSQALEHIDKATSYKNTGNDLLKEGKFKPASFQYKQGLMFVLEYMPKKEGSGDMTEMFSGRRAAAQATEEEKKAACSIAAQLKCNLSLARLKLQDWEGAIRFATETLELEPDNTKAFFRRGSAYLEKGSAAEARRDLEKVEKTDPTLVKALLQRLSKLEAKDSKDRDKLYKKMFAAN
eukprot:TRINITY_DN10475_c0_g1_i2.p2 TRINITY_DN10475_c0_g1~~TRINITY_DN10475_c0_g1_i2.p2  ORF type:complete len:179 (+),score=39.43 TRINITY_DN10475_c0_g1_i2:2648-3184(+)